MSPRSARLPLLTFLVGLSCGVAVSATAGSFPYERLDVFARALAIIEARYVDERDSETLIYDAIGGLTQGLDDHSVFLDPDAYKELREVTRGEYTGIGVDVVSKDNEIEVRRVLDRSPAMEAGLQAGDFIVGVDDVKVEEVGADALQGRIRGETGTIVLLTVRRPNQSELLELPVRRARIKTLSVHTQSLSQGVLLLQIARFQRDTFEEVTAALHAYEEEAGGPPSGLVLDLRGNPGGYLSEAVELSNLWIDSGALVSTIGRSSAADQDIATAANSDVSTPMVVLVDSGSASASEVLAGALGDHGRARLIGYPTYGKGSVQQFFDLPDGSALKITTARYYTPKGKHIHGSGLSPDLALGPRGATEPVLNLLGLPYFEEVSTAANSPELRVALAWLRAPGQVDAWFAARSNSSEE